MKSTAIFNHVLTRTASEYAVNEAEYAAGALFPVFPAAVQAARFPVWLRDNLLTVPAVKPRAAGAPYERADLTLDEDTFATRDYGIELPLDDRQKAIYASALDADRGKVQRGTRILLLNKEQRCHDLATGGGVPSSSPGTKWDAAGGDPIGDIKAAREVIHDNCGLDPNVAIIPRDVFNILIELDQIRDKYKYTQGGNITAQILAAILQVDRVVVAGTVKNAAAEGQAISVAKVWGDSVVLAHVSATLDLESPSFGRTFAWSGYTGAKGGEIAVMSYRENNPPALIHQLKHDVDEKIAAAACGYHLSNVLG
ncbi:hypothetical protein HNR46_001586 [Haloferula luteola]|uniref:Uncharacterized protein n=1 Tax=Haloferula luteola TaxID=595692 RepID=A0A840VBN9_9BACT|nr:major capsid protein [Haloferula luteola]MBB5351350.1 hypothetical protein [Haloferula luteola]